MVPIMQGLESENPEIYQWRGRESLSVVDLLLGSGVPMSRVAKRFRVSRNAIISTYDSAGRKWPGWKGPAKNAAALSSPTTEAV